MLCCGSCYMMEESEPIPKTKISLKDGNKPLRTTQTQCWFWLLVLKGHLSWWICHILRADMWCSCRTTKTCSESKAIFLLSTLVTFPASSLKEENDWPFHANQMQLPYTSSQKISLPDIRTHLWPSIRGVAPGYKCAAFTAQKHRVSFAITALIEGAGQLCSTHWARASSPAMGSTGSLPTMCFSGLAITKQERGRAIATETVPDKYICLKEAPVDFWWQPVTKTALHKAPTRLKYTVLFLKYMLNSLFLPTFYRC